MRMMQAVRASRGGAPGASSSNGQGGGRGSRAGGHGGRGGGSYGGPPERPSHSREVPSGMADLFASRMAEFVEERMRAAAMQELLMIRVAMRAAAAEVREEMTRAAEVERAVHHLPEPLQAAAREMFLARLGAGAPFGSGGATGGGGHLPGGSGGIDFDLTALREVLGEGPEGPREGVRRAASSWRAPSGSGEGGSDASTSGSRCAACGKPASLVRSRCKSCSYCSKECQKSHWRVHRSACSVIASAGGGD